MVEEKETLGIEIKHRQGKPQNCLVWSSMLVLVMQGVCTHNSVLVQKHWFRMNTNLPKSSFKKTKCDKIKLLRTTSAPG
jgi:hypothetical protein